MITIMKFPYLERKAESRLYHRWNGMLGILNCQIKFKDAFSRLANLYIAEEVRTKTVQFILKHDMTRYNDVTIQKKQN